MIVTQKRQPSHSHSPWKRKSGWQQLNTGFCFVLKGDLQSYLTIWPAGHFTAYTEPGPGTVALRVMGSRAGPSQGSSIRSGALSIGELACILPHVSYPQWAGWKYELRASPPRGLTSSITVKENMASNSKCVSATVLCTIVSYSLALTLNLIFSQRACK